MSEQDVADIGWLMRHADPDILALELDRVERALKLVFELGGAVESVGRKNIALRRAHDLIQYLRVANDIE